MKVLYVTADQIGTSTGGGIVTYNESEAMKEMVDQNIPSSCEIWGRDYPLKCDGEDPWGWDINGMTLLAEKKLDPKFDLAHFYAGTFSETIKRLKENNCRITYTAAAHDVEISRKEHEIYGLPFYSHLLDPALWCRYVAGYLAADVVICPSRHSENVMRRFGCRNVRIIPHGVDLPDNVTPLPSHFTVGYLGSCSAPDKGIIYLLQAWKKLNYKDGSILVLAGRDSISSFVYGLVKKYGGGNICLAGWQKNVADFYNSISILVQPSVTEGFGIEVLESLAHGRPVICSDGAGAADVIEDCNGRNTGCGFIFKSRNVDKLAELIDFYKSDRETLKWDGKAGREHAKKYTWEIVRKEYVQVWEDLLK